jgi:hypothetical protein
MGLHPISTGSAPPAIRQYLTRNQLLTPIPKPLVGPHSRALHIQKKTVGYESPTENTHTNTETQN